MLDLTSSSIVEWQVFGIAAEAVTPVQRQCAALNHRARAYRLKTVVFGLLGTYLQKRVLAASIGLDEHMHKHLLASDPAQHVHTHARAHACARTHARARARTHTRTHTRTPTHTQALEYTHERTHARTRRPP
eukprot:6191740-Pleurochrysis_carterae.AAC.1